jgi:hypothetical protein
MRAMNRFQINTGAIASILSLALIAACSSDENKSTNTTDGGGSGGESNAGGSKGSGGSKATGGGSNAGGSKATGGGSSAGGSKGTGGSKVTTDGGTTDGSTTDGGTVKDGGGGDAESYPDAGAVCDQYCEDILATCTGANKQFDDEAACNAACGAYNRTGTPGATGGNSLQCRLYHLNAAKTDANTHCGHAGPTGNNTCVGAVQ